MLMDLSIKLITPELMEEFGAEAFDMGLGVNDHGMNPGSHAIRDWQAGWHRQRVKRQKDLAWAKHELAQGCPP
jgi:hypothetical protein